MDSGGNRDAVKLKESYGAFLACGTLEASDRYRLAEAKTRALEEFGDPMEYNFGMAPKRFYSTI